MTLREAITRKKRVAAVVTYVALAWYIVVMTFSGAKYPWFYVALPGFLLFFAGFFYLLFFLRCPRCRARLGTPSAT
jgi:hypothetical protein